VQFSELQKLLNLDLDLGSDRSYLCACAVEVYRHTELDRNRKNFFVDGRTDGQKDLEFQFIKSSLGDDIKKITTANRSLVRGDGVARINTKVRISGCC